MWSRRLVVLKICERNSGQYMRTHSLFLILMIIQIQLASGQSSSTAKTTLTMKNSTKRVPSSGVSPVHKPVLSLCTEWNLSGVTIANSTSAGSNLLNAFVDINDTVYITDQIKRTIQILPTKKGLTNKTITNSSAFSTGIFVPNTGGIYIDEGNNSFVRKWSNNDGSNLIVMQINRGCNSLFISTDAILYCSINSGHLVVKMSLDLSEKLLTAAAGTGCAGSTSDRLDQPFGIYVDVNFDLYVADTGNDRIQLFHDGELNGTTVAGRDATTISALNRPTSVILDGDNYLFIVDSGNQRIVRVGPGVYQCVIGCSPQSCSQPDQLCNPLTAIFDSSGNMYVNNMNSIQKYILATNSCASTTSTTESTIAPTCFPPNVTLFPGPSSYEIPRGFRRSQDFYITANLKLICAESLKFDIKWSIFNCTPNCTVPANIDSSTNTSLTELFFPARTLTYGLYQMRLTVTMSKVPQISTTQSAFVQIDPSGITANLVQFGTSIVTSGENQDLELNPGHHSKNPDENVFNASDWTYQYQCRVYNLTHVTTWTSLGEPNHPCFSNRKDHSLAYQYKTGTANQSAVIILKGSLRYNHTYQFLVSMTNRRNLTSQATGYVIVNIGISEPKMVAIACVISTMCNPNLDYQYINPSTQVALLSDCVSGCDSLLQTQWKIYQGVNDSSGGIVKWELFPQILHCYGLNTTKFTASNSLFRENEGIFFWRFEVTYKFQKENSTSALNFMINQPPNNGTCTIDPPNGTTSTLFTINCTGWLDDEKIKDYTFYRRITSTEQVMLAILPAFSEPSILEIQLPAGDDNTSMVNLTVQIRDKLNCVKDFDMEPVIVTPDLPAIDSLIDLIGKQENGSASNAIVQALASGNPNQVGQAVTILSQEFNKRNKQGLEMAVANGTPAASISISPLGSEPASEPSGSKNGSISAEYVQKLTHIATVREYLMRSTTNLAVINDIDIIKLQASTLAQLTEATNELTRSATLLASKRCHELGEMLQKRRNSTSYEDAKFASEQIALCVNHVSTAINAPLQQRGVLFNSSSPDEDINQVDYDSDPEIFELALRAMVNEEDWSSESMKKDRNFYYQKKAANYIAEQSAFTVAFITSALDVHLNVGQKANLSSPSLLVSLETTTMGSLSNKTIQQVGTAQFHIPSDFKSNLPENASISLRSTMQPLASLGALPLQANTNMSTTISLAIIDEYENEVPIQATEEQPIAFFIPRDSTLILPDMHLKDAISRSSEESFNLSLSQYVKNKNLTVSLHFEFRPLNISVGYLFIYQFDRTPQLNSAKKDIDDWELFCPSNLSNENIYQYYINNRKTASHQAVVYQLRELNSTEVRQFCPRKSDDNPPIFDEPANFTWNYELRIYSSGCYYLDQHNNWQSDGLWVGPLTDHHQTQCFATYLTTITKK